MAQSHKPGAEDSVAEQAGVSESGREGMNQTYQLFKAARSLRNRFLQVLMRRCAQSREAESARLYRRAQARTKRLTAMFLRVAELE